jgi:hypothetical protein
MTHGVDKSGGVMYIGRNVDIHTICAADSFQAFRNAKHHSGETL